MGCADFKLFSQLLPPGLDHAYKSISVAALPISSHCLNQILVSAHSSFWTDLQIPNPKTAAPS